MRAVAFKCPATGKTVVLEAKFREPSSPSEVTTIARCPHCADQHSWRVRVGKPVSWLELLTPPPTRHNARFSPIQSASRAFGQ